MLRATVRVADKTDPATQSKSEAMSALASVSTSSTLSFSEGCSAKRVMSGISLAKTSDASLLQSLLRTQYFYVVSSDKSTDRIWVTISGPEPERSSTI